MSTDTHPSKHWTPFRILTILGGWLLLVILMAVAIASGCGANNPPATNGSITLTWSILDGNQKPTTCAQVGARSVALRLRNRAGGAIVATAFPCEASPGAAEVAASTYDVAIELHAADGSKLATGPDQPGIAITAGRITRLTPVTFTASTETTLVLSIATSTAANCSPVTSQGAGITASQITLLHTGDGCAPVTFTRQRGAESRGTYTVSCGIPQVALCVERDETLTTSVAPGSYTIHVVGKIGAADCWRRDDIFEVPPAGGKPLVHPVGLVHQNTPGC